MEVADDAAHSDHQSGQRTQQAAQRGGGAEVVSRPTSPVSPSVATPDFLALRRRKRRATSGDSGRAWCAHDHVTVYVGGRGLSSPFVTDARVVIRRRSLRIVARIGLRAAPWAWSGESTPP